MVQCSEGAHCGSMFRGGSLWLNVQRGLNNLSFPFRVGPLCHQKDCPKFG